MHLSFMSTRRVNCTLIREGVGWAPLTKAHRSRDGSHARGGCVDRNHLRHLRSPPMRHCAPMVGPGCRGAAVVGQPLGYLGHDSQWHRVAARKLVQLAEVLGHVVAAHPILYVTIPRAQRVDAVARVTQPSCNNGHPSGG